MLGRGLLKTISHWRATATAGILWLIPKLAAEAVTAIKVLPQPGLRVGQHVIVDQKTLKFQNGQTKLKQ